MLRLNGITCTFASPTSFHFFQDQLDKDLSYLKINEMIMRTVCWMCDVDQRFFFFRCDIVTVCIVILLHANDGANAGSHRAIVMIS